jgi:type IX secretion system PorP/SprF family membrane protein
MKKLFVFYLCMLLTIQVFSQKPQDSYSQYMVNGLAINPAYAGVRDVFSTSFLFKKQWTGINGSPMAQTFSAHAPTRNDKVGLGLFLMNKQEAYVQEIESYLNYAFRVHIGTGKLSLGLKAGVIYKLENLSDIISKLDDPTDPSFANAPESEIQPNFGTGFYYYTERFFIGGSVPLLLNYVQDTLTYKSKFFFSPENNTYMLTAGALVNILDGFKWKPTILIKFLGYNSTFQIDINSNFIFWEDRLWLGTSIRTGEEPIGSTVIGLLEVKLTEQFMIGYSYDHSLGNLNTIMNGAHEIFLRYEFGYKVKATNPRYF